ncbi:hypothetical protein ACFYOT_39560 [Saccharothrix saharensis]|uniref:DUF7668 domain-containing protein n=1 Tax=Saccharothrix saharensis TaxID=571190 RepID=UPI0036998E14
MAGDDAPPEVRRLVRRAVGMLAAGEFHELERWTGGRRLSAEDMAQVLERYEVLPVLPTDEELFAETDFYDVSGDGSAYHVETNLWSDHGVTDLQLRLDIAETTPGHYSVEVNDLLIP